MGKEYKLPTGISAYAPKEQGFFPVVFFGQWRVAVLNYCDIVEKDALYRLERHVETDEVFVLQKGQAWLILGGSGDAPACVETFPMETGVVYNIARSCWHHVVMTRDASVLIVENADTGDSNSAYANLSEGVVTELKEKISFS